MKRFLAVGCVAALTLGVTGCGSNAESNLKEQISLMNQMGDAIKSNDKAKLEEIGKKMTELKEAFGKFPAEEQKAAMEKMGPELTKAGLNMLGGMGDMLKQGMGDMLKGGGGLIPGGGNIPKLPGQ